MHVWRCGVVLRVTQPTHTHTHTPTTDSNAVQPQPVAVSRRRVTYICTCTMCEGQWLSVTNAPPPPPPPPVLCDLRSQPEWGCAHYMSCPIGCRCTEYNAHTVRSTVRILSLLRGAVYGMYIPGHGSDGTFRTGSPPAAQRTNRPRTLYVHVLYHPRLPGYVRRSVLEAVVGASYVGRSVNTPYILRT